MLHGCHWKWYFSEVLMRNWKVSQCDSPVVERALILQWVLQFYSRVRVAGWRMVICKLYTVKFYNWQIMKRSISPSLSVCHRRCPDTECWLPLQVYVDTRFATQPGSAGTRQIGAIYPQIEIGRNNCSHNTMKVQLSCSKDFLPLLPLHEP